MTERSSDLVEKQRALCDGCDANSWELHDVYNKSVLYFPLGRAFLKVDKAVLELNNYGTSDKGDSCNCRWRNDFTPLRFPVGFVSFS